MLSSKSRTIYPLSLLSLLLYYYIGYQVLRFETMPLFLSYAFLFGIYVLLAGNSSISLRQILLLGVFSRLVLFMMIPNLSDDIFRFIWDGRLLNHGIHPFEAVPAHYISEGILPDFLTNELFEKLNSPGYFTVYPPFAQYLFMLATWVSPRSELGSILVIRAVILLAEIGTAILMIRLLRQKKVEIRKFAWYWLNPLIILELTGNLHFEGFVIFFLLASIYYLSSKSAFSGGLWGFSIAAKLHPAMYGPLFYRYHPKTGRWYFVLGAVLSILILFVPLWNLSFVHGMQESLSLYFQKFEFNASLYYIIRKIGYIVKGYDIIATSAPTLAVMAFGIIIFFSLWVNKKRYLLLTAMGSVWCMYLLFSTTVHPWYIIPLVAFMLFQGFYFPVLWSFLIFMTYAGYSASDYQENLWLVCIEYVPVIILAAYEYYLLHRNSLSTEDTEPQIIYNK